MNFIHAQESRNLKNEIKFEVLAEISDSTNKYQISSLIGVGTDSLNNIYLFDFILNSVIRLDDEGRFESQIIRDGRGPGEINSIYSYYFDPKNDLIYIADRRNYRLLITDVDGNEVASFPILPNKMNPPMRMKVYDDSTLVLLFSNSRQQLMRKEEGIDSLIHFFNKNTFEWLYSIGNRKTVNKNIGYRSEAAELVNKIFVGEILFYDLNTLLFSPYVFNKSILVYKRNGESDWKYAGKLKSREWSVDAFEEIDYDEYQENRKKYRQSGRNYVSSSSLDGRGAGSINLRSAGIYKMKNDKIVNFIILEKQRANSFYHQLFAEVYSKDLKLIHSSLIYEGGLTDLLRSVSWKDKDQNFFLIIEKNRYNTKILKFHLSI